MHLLSLGLTAQWEFGKQDLEEEVLTAQMTVSSEKGSDSTPNTSVTLYPQTNEGPRQSSHPLAKVFGEDVEAGLRLRQ